MQVSPFVVFFRFLVRFDFVSPSIREFTEKTQENHLKIKENSSACDLFAHSAAK